jgi:tRNA threonylcarbamoyladenosine biosynthesis protein TsaE
MPTWRCTDSHSTAALGEALGRSARGGEALALTGTLGAGKTVFAQGLARGLGLTGPIPSPTYAIVHVHEGPVPLWHADLYRVEHAADLAPLALDEASLHGAVLVVEWASRFPEALPPDHLAVAIHVAEGEAREVTITPLGPASAAWLARLPDAR